jgi:recombination protein RecA
MMSQAMRKLSGVISKSNCVVIFINQIREKVGVMYGNPETTPGGRALKFFASVRIDVRKTEQLKDGNNVYGNHVKCKIVKNKVAPPFRVAEFDILFGKGISKASEMIEMGVALGVLKKSGAWINYGDQRIGQGKDNARKTLENDRALAEEIEAKIRAIAAEENEVVDEIEDEDELDEELREFELDEE